jgi:hypothetical protein
MANATGMAPSGRLKLVTSGRILDAAVRSRVKTRRFSRTRIAGQYSKQMPRGQLPYSSVSAQKSSRYWQIIRPRISASSL